MAKPKSEFTLARFITAVKTKNLARPNRFEVIFTSPESTRRVGNFTESRNDFKSAELVSLFCEISNLPGITITTKGQRIYGPAYQRPISLEYGGEAIAMTFYVDRSFEVKQFFDKWIFSIVNPTNYNVSYDESDLQNGSTKYTTDITINQLDETDAVTYSIKLIDAFPKAMNMMDLNMGATNQVHKLNVTFGYRKWTTIYEKYFPYLPEKVLQPISDKAALNLGYDDNSNQNTGPIDSAL